MTRVSNRTLLVLALTLAIGACGKTDPAAQPAPADGAAPGAAATPAATSAGGVPVFAEYAAAEIARGGSCALDAINGESAQDASLPTGTTAIFGGWVVGATGNVPAQAQLLLRGAKSYSAPLIAGGERTDVAAALNNEAARLSGYNLTASLAGVEAGKYDMSIVVGDATPSTCLLNRQLTVTAN